MSDNRTAILQCSLALFAAKGYDAVGVQQIVEEAGIKKPTLYHYFGSKRGVLETLMEEQFQPFLAQLKEAATYAGDLPLTLRRITSTYFDFASDQPTLYRMHLAAWFANPESEASLVISPLVQEQHQILENIFEKAANQHGNMQGRQRVYAASLLGTINTYISLFLHQKLVLTQQTSLQAVQQFSHGIYS